jgi:hypothetical protein
MIVTGFFLFADGKRGSFDSTLSLEYSHTAKAGGDAMLIAHLRAAVTSPLDLFIESTPGECFIGWIQDSMR